MENRFSAQLSFLRSVWPGKTWPGFSFSMCKVDVGRATSVLSLQPQLQDQGGAFYGGRAQVLLMEALLLAMDPCSSLLSCTCEVSRCRAVALHFTVPLTCTLGIFTLVTRHLPPSLHCGAAQEETELFNML